MDFVLVAVKVFFVSEACTCGWTGGNVTLEWFVMCGYDMVAKRVLANSEML
jgi:hypothetical protein